MKLLTILYIFCLLYVFVPGNVIKLPIKTSNTNIILIHAFAFSVILSCTYDFVDHVNLIEGQYQYHESKFQKEEDKEEEKRVRARDRKEQEIARRHEGFKEGGPTKEQEEEIDRQLHRQNLKEHDGW